MGTLRRLPEDAMTRAVIVLCQSVDNYITILHQNRAGIILCLFTLIFERITLSYRECYEGEFLLVLGSGLSSRHYERVGNDIMPFKIFIHR